MLNQKIKDGIKIRFEKNRNDMTMTEAMYIIELIKNGLAPGGEVSDNGCILYESICNLIK